MTDERIDIEGVEDIDVPNIGKLETSSYEELEDQVAQQKIKGPNKEVVEVATDRESLLKRMYGFGLKVVRGRNKAGQAIGGGLDIAGLFVPAIAKFRTIAKRTLNLTQPTTMDKPKLLSKTVWGAIIIALTALLQAFGVDFSADPELVNHIYEVVYGLAGAFGLYGLRDAIGQKIKRESVAQ